MHMLRTILLVENDPVQCNLFALLLRAAEYHVVTVLDAENALSYLAAQHVALVIADMHLPGLTARELFTHIHRHYPDTPTLLMGTHDHISVIAHSWGAQGWFQKLDSIEIFHQHIAQLLS